MANQIKGKYIQNAAIDGTKLLLKNNDGLRSLRSDGDPEVLLKLDSSDKLILMKVPEVSADASTANGLVRKSQLDAQINEHVTSKLGVASGIATLGSDGKIPSAQIPALAISSITVVADIAARDALTGVEEGDVVKVTDAGAGLPKTYIFNGSSFIEVESGSDVDTVNGYTGTVVLTASDINLVADSSKSVEQKLIDLQSELDASQTGAGLETDGSYAANSASVYLTSATSLKDADNKLDAAIDALQGQADDVQDELDATQTGAGLNSDGSYSANSTAQYISMATSLKDADEKLAEAIYALQSEVNTTQTGAGLGTDGSYSAHAGSSYLKSSDFTAASAVPSLHSADKLLDAAIADIQDQIDSLSPNLEGLSDVTITSKANKDVIRWNSTAGKWVNATLTASDINMASGDSIQAAIESIQTDIENVSPDLDGLADVTISGKADEDLIQWDSATSKWLNVAPISAGALAYASLKQTLADFSGADTWQSPKSVSVSADGSTMAFGASYESTSPNGGQGAVWIYKKDANGTWAEEAKLIPSAAASWAGFGWSVSLSSDGNTIVVGEVNGQTSGTNTGAAYIFKRTGSTWSESQRLTPSDVPNSAQFGYSVSISDDASTVAVGAQANDNYTGAAYVYSLSDGSYSEEAKLQAAELVTYDYFGYSVALSSNGNTLVVGAPYRDESGQYDSGSAYVYKRASGTWSEFQELAPDTVGYQQRFGYSVGMSNDGSVIVVGAPWNSTMPNWENGAVYVFAMGSSTYAQEQKLHPVDSGNAYVRFGWSVSVNPNGTVVAAGAPEADYNDGSSNYNDNGATFVFAKESGSWSLKQKVNGPENYQYSRFGESVSLSGSTVIALAAGYPNQSQKGAAYIYDLAINGAPKGLIKTNSLGQIDQSFFQYNVNFGGNKLSGLLSPSASSDAATKGYVDGQITNVNNNINSTNNTVNNLNSTVSGHTTRLNSLSLASGLVDVTASGASAGDLLRYTGSVWKIESPLLQRIAGQGTGTVWDYKALWKFDESSGTLMDSAGSNHLTPQGAVTYGEPGVTATGTAVTLSGSPLISANDFNGWKSTPTDFSLSIWFKTTNNWGSLWKFEGMGNGPELNINGTGVYVYNWPNSHVYSQTVNVTDGNWHHAVVTWGSNGTRLYIDGALNASDTATTSNYQLINSNFLMKVGVGFTGSVDKLAIFNNQLSASDVSSIYSTLDVEYVPGGNLRTIKTTSDGYIDESFLQYDIDFDGHKLQGVSAPTADTDAANKGYVDDINDALAGRLDTLEGADTVEGSVAKAEKDAKDYADQQIEALVTDKLGVANGIATLGSNGKLPSSQVPALAISSITVVADIAARDALTGVEEGDVVKVTDAGSSLPKTYIYDGAAYIEIESGSDVDTVNGYTGTVVLTASDINMTSGASIEVTMADLQDEIDTTQIGAGLETDGSYSAPVSSNYLGSTTSLKDADEKLDTEVKAVQDELDATQIGAGLGTDGSYSAPVSSNYLGSATDLKDADSKLDTAIKAVQDELDAAQTGAGLEADGTYAAPSSSNYLASASSLKDADSKLDTEVKAVQDELDTTQIGAGLETDGSYSAPVSSNYLASASSLKDADSKIDSAVGAINTRLEAVEDLAVTFHKEKFVITATDISNGYIELANTAVQSSIVAFVDRLAIHEYDGTDGDYTVSVVAGKTRITFAGSLVHPSEEKLSEGDVLRVTYAKLAI